MYERPDLDEETFNRLYAPPRPDSQRWGMTPHFLTPKETPEMNDVDYALRSVANAAHALDAKWCGGSSPAEVEKAVQRLEAALAAYRALVPKPVID